MPNVFPVSETDRLAALAHFAVLDTAPEAAFDRITSLAAHLFGMPIARISFVDETRVWFKSSYGLPAHTSPREHATCARVILSEDVFIVPDVSVDPRFREDPLVVREPRACFYAGAPLRTAEGFNLGVLCLVDLVPREFGAVQQESLKQLATVVVEALQARLANRQLAEEVKVRQRAEATLGQALAGRGTVPAAAFDAIIGLDHAGRIVALNPAAERLFGRSLAETIGQKLVDLFIAPGGRADHRHDTEGLFADGDKSRLGERLPLLARYTDGTEFPVEMVITACAEGRPCAYTGHVRDLTGRYAGENRLRMLESSLVHANDAILITEAEPVGEPGPRIIYVNEAFTTTTGYTMAEVLGKTPRLLQGPNTDPVAKRKIYDALVQWQEVRVELLNYRKDGSEFWVELNIVPVDDGHGNWTHWVSIQRVITERRAEQGKLEEQVRLAAMGAEIGLMLTRHDLLADVLHRCTEVLVRHLGAAFARVWTLNETTDVLELQASAGLYTHLDGPHSRVPVGKFKIGLIAQERLPHLTNQVVGDPRVSDQAWAKENGMVAFAGYPLIVEDRLVGVMALFSREALTQPAFQALEAIANAIALGIQHRQAQAERGRLAREVHLLLESTSEGVCGIDLEGRLAFINRCGAQMLGYSAEELVGRGMHPLVHHHHADGSFYASADCPIHGAVHRGQEVRADDEVFWRSDGTTIPVEYSCSPINEDGQVRGSVVTFSDITARKQAEVALREAKHKAEEAQAEAERANAAKSEFLSRMSHELRTPLNAILGFGQLLEMQPQTPRQRENVSHILKGGKHLLDLINEVLDIARIESGKLELTLAAINVAEVFAEAAALIQPLAAKRNVHVGQCVGRACAGAVQADRQRLNQVVLNLLSNAVKYNRPGGTVSISCEPATPAGFLRLAVSDTGPGIAPADLGKLFVPFERLGAGGSGVEGTGIGLALSKRLVEAMGGTIDVESVPGRGSTFYMELPASGMLPVAAGQAEEPTPENRPVRGAAVLYIEDNPSNYALVEQVLELQRPAIHLLGAMLGQLGLDMAREHRPDLILLDLQLPDLSGEEVLRQLQADDSTRGIPVIMVSADAMAEKPQRLLELGARSYLTKPLRISALVESIDDGLAGEANLLPRTG